MYRYLLSLILGIFLFSSCATIFKGNKQEIYFTSDPPNAKVYAAEKVFVYPQVLNLPLTEIGTTPCTVTVHKLTPYFVFKKEGYRDVNHLIRMNLRYEPIGWLNIFNGLFPGGMIDLLNGSALKLPPVVHQELILKQ